MSTPEFWRAVEAIHSPIYFADSVALRFKDLGLKGFWMGYVASRSAAMGTPGPELVTAVFHGFAPHMIARALPDAWSFADRDDILSTRHDAARELLAPAITIDVSSTARHLNDVLARASFAGKPLAAAHAALPQPDDPIGRLWHHATWLREFHGDAHIAVLTAAGLDGATANALASALGMVPPGQQAKRGWSDQQWDDAFEQLHMRGWVDEFRAPTDAGRSARARLEDATDRVANAGIGDREATARTIAATASLVQVAQQLRAADLMPYPNPIGMDPVAADDAS